MSDTNQVKFSLPHSEVIDTKDIVAQVQKSTIDLCEYLIYKNQYDKDIFFAEYAIGVGLIVTSMNYISQCTLPEFDNEIISEIEAFLDKISQITKKSIEEHNKSNAE